MGKVRFDIHDLFVSYKEQSDTITLHINGPSAIETNVVHSWFYNKDFCSKQSSFLFIWSRNFNYLINNPAGLQIGMLYSGFLRQS